MQEEAKLQGDELNIQLHPITPFHFGML